MSKLPKCGCRKKNGIDPEFHGGNRALAVDVLFSNCAGRRRPPRLPRLKSVGPRLHLMIWPMSTIKSTVVCSLLALDGLQILRDIF